MVLCLIKEDNTNGDAMNIGANLKVTRQSRGLSQTQVANYLGIDQTTLSKIENGTRTIRVVMLEKLAALYFCSLDQLLDETPKSPNAIAFRTKSLDGTELESLAEIGRIVGNLEEMIALKESFTPKDDHEHLEHKHSSNEVSL